MIRNRSMLEAWPDPALVHGSLMVGLTLSNRGTSCVHALRQYPKRPLSSTDLLKEISRVTKSFATL